ncbi:MAG: SsrA-binding protein SmpB [Armatimonadota bacterium]
MKKETVARNRKARYEYFVEDTYEAGIELKGAEVKSLRAHNVSLNEAYATVEGGQVWVIGMHISPYEAATNAEEINPTRRRRLLLKRREIDRIERDVVQKGYTLIPLEIYFNRRGYAKMTLGICRGKKQYDKRRAIKERDEKRRTEQALSEFERS